jgi:transcriptional regulator with XRE-family HTH domain
MQDECKNFPETLTAYREERGLSQQGLADFLGVSRRTIANWEAGDNLPPKNRLHNFLEKLHSSKAEEADWKSRAIAAETKLRAIQAILEPTPPKPPAQTSSPPRSDAGVLAQKIGDGLDRGKP